ncbi:MAG TPA: sigma-54 dependent transcriptional regulator [Longimicrobiaceae bacterium]|nr:sigma-54 dependent transcriptional regulator [Longimicrobiaceae bacterium]
MSATATAGPRTDTGSGVAYTRETGLSRPDILALPPEFKSTVRVLVVEDEHTLRESCASVLEHEGYDVTSCGRGDEAREILQRRSFDVVLLDLYMSQVDGMELLGVCLERSPETLVVVMTGNPSVSSSVQALRAGAWDYLPKPFTATHLQVLCGRACHTVMVARESGQEEPSHGAEPGRGEKVPLLGRSPALLRAVELARKVARTDASVFITGESGTGKEMFAQFIHHHSRRASRAWVPVNSAALPETLLESEMFGHVKGAFTGAIRDKAGLLETANGGTFFLDELTEMSQPIQAKLLRVIQDGVVRRVGSESVDAIVNVRFIAATNRDAREAMESGILRKDLYYRLSVVPIRLPSLRERVEDIPLLAEHFLSLYWKKHRERGTRIPRFTAAAIRELQQREWKGNVRELQNVMEHAVVFLEPGSEIRPDDLPAGDGPPRGDPPAALFEEWPGDGPYATEGSYHAERERVLARFELSYLSWLVERAGANMSRAAKIAGVDRTTLYRLMEKHRLHRDTVIAPLNDESRGGS